MNGASVRQKINTLTNAKNVKKRKNFTLHMCLEKKLKF